MINKMSGALAALIFGALMAPIQAAATEGIEWKWEDGQARRYLVRTQVDLPAPIPLNAEMNKELRITAFILSMDLRCEKERDLGKKAWELRCDIADLALSATAVPGDAGRLEPVLAEFESNFKAGSFQLQFAKNGALRDIGLEDVPVVNNRRTNEIQEIMRLMAIRGLSAFDINLPKNGDDKGSGQWAQRQTLAFLIPWRDMNYASASLVHTVSGINENKVSFNTQGSGITNSGEINGRPLWVFDMAYSGSAVFDKAAGEMLEVQYMVDGRPSSSSISGTSAPYIQATVLQLIDPDRELDFGESEELSNE